MTSLMKRTLLPLFALSMALQACATDGSAVGTEDDLTRLKVSVLGDIKIEGSLDAESQYVGRPLATYRAYKFDVTAGTAVDIHVAGGIAPEAILLDGRKMTMKTSTFTAGEYVNEATIKGVSFDAAGSYFVAFRDTGDLTSEKAKASTVRVTVARNFDRAPISTFSCVTKDPIDDKVEHMSFAIAYIDDATIGPQLLPLPGKEEDGLYIAGEPDGYSDSLNENLGFELTDGRLRVYGDADGVYLVELGLYANSGFQHGFFRVYNSSDIPDTYSLVECSVTKSTGR
jgi:hypothetical protein